MIRKRIYLSAAIVIPALSLLLVGSNSWGQEVLGDQEFNDLAAIGQSTAGNGLVKPDLANEDDDPSVDYFPIVGAPAGQVFRDFEFDANGEPIVLLGTVFQKFTSKGELVDPVTGYPFDCADLTFEVLKNNGDTRTESISDCQAFTVLNNGELRIAVEARGGGFKIISYVPATGATALTVDGAPPDITDMDSREFPDAAESALGAGYLYVGERSKVLYSRLDDEQDIIQLARLSGERIDAATSLGANKVVVILDTGELRVLDVTNPNSVAISEGTLDELTSVPGCVPGRRDPQKYSLRWDPSGVLFAANSFCQRIVLFDENLVRIPENPDEGLAANPLLLNDPVGFSPDGIDWTVGIPGNFEDCQGGALEFGCDFDREELAARMWAVKFVAGTDPSFLTLKFVYPDCRWALDELDQPLDCPIKNCRTRWPEWNEPGTLCEEPDPTKQVLDLTPLFAEIDESGVFEDLLFPDGNPEEMLIPAYLRGERFVPRVPAVPGTPVDCSDPDDPVHDTKCAFNGFEMVTYVAINKTVFTDIFFVDYQLDIIRNNGSIDPCLSPILPESEIGAVNETANIILYNSSDEFGTVDRATTFGPGYPFQGDVQGTRGGVIGNSFCNGGASRFRWSANTVSIEFYEDKLVDDVYVKVPNPTLYVDQVRRMMAELRQVKEDLICQPFTSGGTTYGPLLLDGDCNTLETNLVQVDQKLEVCIDSLFASQQGNSAENCNAFFTKVTNLRNATASAAWPIPPDPAPPGADLTLFEPNREGEFISRIDALEFFVSNYMLSAVPAGGIVVSP